MNFRDIVTCLPVNVSVANRSQDSKSNTSVFIPAARPRDCAFLTSDSPRYHTCAYLLVGASCMLNNLNVLGSADECLLMSLSAGNDHAGVSEEAVRWEATPDLPVRPLPLHLCGFENLSEFSLLAF